MTLGTRNDAAGEFHKKCEATTPVKDKKWREHML
jgi:hypothetical protein